MVDGTRHERGAGAGILAELDCPGNMNLEGAEEQDELPAAFFRGVQVEDRLGRVTEGTRMAVLALDPSQLGHIPQHGGCIKGSACKQEGARAHLAGRVVATVSHAVVVLEASTPMEKAPNGTTDARTDSVHESMTHNLLNHQLHHVVHLSSRGNWVDTQPWVGIAEGG